MVLTNNNSARPNNPGGSTGGFTISAGAVIGARRAEQHHLGQHLHHPRRRQHNGQPFQPLPGDQRGLRRLGRRRRGPVRDHRHVPIAGAAAVSSTFNQQMWLNENVNLAQVAGGTLNVNNTVQGSGGSSITVNLVGPGVVACAGLTNGTGTLAVNVNNPGGVAAISGGGGNCTYTGGTTVTSGSLLLTGPSNWSGNGEGDLIGTVTVQPGAALVAQPPAMPRAPYNTVLGYGNGGSGGFRQGVSTLNLNGGLLYNNTPDTNQAFSGTLNMSGGTLGAPRMGFSSNVKTTSQPSS